MAGKTMSGSVIAAIDAVHVAYGEPVTSESVHAAGTVRTANIVGDLLNKNHAHH